MGRWQGPGGPGGGPVEGAAPGDAAPRRVHRDVGPVYEEAQGRELRTAGLALPRDER
ncbi:unnamed protein product, partial [Heterosigma akashiwo]